MCQDIDMSQVEGVGPVDQAVGYVLKQAATALRSALDVVLRPLGLTVPQYSCLEVLDQRPGLSSSELARATFVTRQSMNLVLQGLQERGLLTRAAVADHGKARPTELTDPGRVKLRAASGAVRTVEKQMLAPLTRRAQQRLLADLATCAAALTGEPRTGPHEHPVGN
jgi:DNA-binding MarR family transcriptional regulator